MSSMEYFKYFDNFLYLYAYLVYKFNQSSIPKYQKDIPRENQKINIESILIFNAVVLAFAYDLGYVKNMISENYILFFSIFNFLMYMVGLICINFNLNKAKNNEKINITEFIISCFSIDYICSCSFKNNISEFESKKQNKNLRTDYLRYKNLWNFIFSVCIIGFGFISIFLNLEIRVMEYCLIFICIRLLSRCVEICVAFYNDIVDKEPKTSLLKPSERMKLAIVSGIELSFTTAFLYELLEVFTMNSKYYDLELKEKIVHYFNNLYGSMINTMTFGSGALKKPTYIKYDFIYNSVILIQSITAFVLIVFSIAVYLSSNNADTKIKRPRGRKRH